MSVKLGLAVSSFGAVLTCAVVFAAVADPTSAAVVAGLLVGGPAWCYAMALVSEDADFAGSDRTRSQWLAWLPWTFVTALLVVPNLIVLALFVRDGRLDGGRSPLTWDRMRPGDADHDHHWPD